MIYRNINESDFITAFNSSDTYKNNFSYDGLKALYEYLEQYSDDTGENIELDIVAIACEYSEWDSVIECASEYFAFEGMKYGEEGEELETLEEVEEKAQKFLEDNTQIIDCDNGHIIIANF